MLCSMLFVVSVATALFAPGCQRAPQPARGALPPGQIEALEMYGSASELVLLVSVTEESLERGTPPRKHALHRKATVVRTYKGTWDVADALSFYEAIEDVPPRFDGNDILRPQPSISLVLFLKTRPTTEVFIDTGRVWTYRSEMEPYLEKLSR